MRERFVDEPLIPVTAAADTGRMAAGEPGLPEEFLWRGKSLQIGSVLRTWRETGRCSHGSPEMYARKHWFEVTATTGERLKIYFERQPRRGRKGPRWWLFSMVDAVIPPPLS